MNYIGLAGTVGSYNAFAYCENKPISSYDYTGKATDYSSLNVPSRQVFSQTKRYAANKKLTKEIEAITPNIFEKYINGQGRVPYKHYLFGAYYTSYNGCGWIATYNALIYLKKKGKLKKWIKPHDVINGIENYSTAKYIGTTFGITTKSISKYIDSLNIDSTVSERTRGFKTAEIEKT